MITNFEALSNDEFEMLKRGVSWITILVAGADGKIDSKEISWASKIAKIRSYSYPELLKEYYAYVGSDFDEQLQELLEQSPSEAKVRTGIAVDKLTELNPILAKLPNKVSAGLYNSFTSFATHVAKASGGFVGMWSVGYEENKYIDLPMIDPIVLVEE